MYNDQYVYNGPATAGYWDPSVDHHAAAAARWHDDEYTLTHHSDDRQPAPRAQSTDLLRALSRLHAEQETIMATLLDVAPSPAHTRTAPRPDYLASSAPWPARAAPRERSPPHAPYSPRRLGDYGMYEAGDPRLAYPVHRDPMRPSSVLRGPSPPRDSAVSYAAAQDIYESLYGRPVEALTSRPRPTSPRRAPLPKSNATVAYYQRMASLHASTTPPTRAVSPSTDPRHQDEQGNGDHTSTVAASRPAAAAQTRVPVRRAQLSQTQPAPSKPKRTVSPAAKPVPPPLVRHAQDRDRDGDRDRDPREAGRRPARAASSRPHGPASRSASRTNVSVQPGKSASWAFKLVESVEAQAASRYQTERGTSAQRVPSPSQQRSAAGRDEQWCEQGRQGTPASVAAMVVSHLTQRAGALRWRPLLTDLAACVHAYRDVCPASAVFRHYFIDGRPKAVVLFQLHCVVLQALLRSSRVTTTSVPISAAGSRAGEEDVEAVTLVSRRYVDLREIVMLISVVLSALVVPEVRFVMRSSTEAAHTRARSGRAAASSATTTAPPPPQFTRRYRRLHTREQRDVQRLLMDWISLSVRQIQTLGGESEPGVMAEPNLVAFDRDGFVDAHALAEATVEALDVTLPLYEPESDGGRDNRDEDEEEEVKESEDDEVESETEGQSGMGTHPGVQVFALSRAPQPAPVPPKGHALGYSPLEQSEPAPRRPRVLPLSPAVPRGNTHEAEHHAYVQPPRKVVSSFVQHHWAGDEARRDSLSPPNSDDPGRAVHDSSDEDMVAMLKALDPCVHAEEAERCHHDSADNGLAHTKSPPRHRASTPPPSAVKRRKEFEAVAAAAAAHSSRRPSTSNCAEGVFAPHALARRLLEVDVSDYLDDFAAEIHNSKDDDEENEDERRVTPCMEEGRSGADKGPAAVPPPPPTPPPPVQPTEVEKQDAAENRVEPMIRVVSRHPAGAERLPSPEMPPQPPRVEDNNAAADDRALSAIERYRMRQRATAPAQTPPTVAASAGETTGEKSSSTALIDALRARLRESEARRAETTKVTMSE